MPLEKNDPYAALRIKEFRLFIAARFLLTFSIQIQSVIVGWQIYQITNNPFSLGLIGLAEAIPAISVALFGGHLADTLDRKSIIVSVCLVLFGCSMGLFFVAHDTFSILMTTGVVPIYVIIFISGLARGIMGPAVFAFWPQIITDKSNFANAVTWNSSTWQIASTAGPAIGGLMIAPLGIAYSYLIDAGFVALSLLLFLQIGSKPLNEYKRHENFWINLGDGLRFVFGNQIILGAISLDLFAVLFGGAVALMPVFARDILHSGAFEFGLLKAAPGVGAVITALTLAFYPIKHKAGKIMLGAVAGFALCMIAFGLSDLLWLSLIILIISGLFDGISVVIRSTLVQTYTPDHMKGRVSAVNNIFIGSSNEIGAFESGAMARLMGVVPSVIFGGTMSLAVVGITWIKAKKLRNLDLL